MTLLRTLPRRRIVSERRHGPCQSTHTHHVTVADTVSIPASIPPEPTKADVAAALRMLEPLRKVIKPKVYGIENVPERRALLVGNHNTLGVLDSPLLAAELWE